jgi:hypothetical protein
VEGLLIRSDDRGIPCILPKPQFRQMSHPPHRPHQSRTLDEPCDNLLRSGTVARDRASTAFGRHGRSSVVHDIRGLNCIECLHDVGFRQMASKKLTRRGLVAIQLRYATVSLWVSRQEPNWNAILVSRRSEVVSLRRTFTSTGAHCSVAGATKSSSPNNTPSVIPFASWSNEIWESRRWQRAVPGPDHLRQLRSQ